MAGTDMAAQAYGMPNVGASSTMSTDELIKLFTGLDAPQTTAGGARGYSGADIYDQQKAQLPEVYRNFIDSFFINPETGIGPLNPTVPRTQYKANQTPKWNKQNARANRRARLHRSKNPADPVAPEDMPYDPEEAFMNGRWRA